MATPVCVKSCRNDGQLVWRTELSLATGVRPGSGIGSLAGDAFVGSAGDDFEAVSFSVSAKLSSTAVSGMIHNANSAVAVSNGLPRNLVKTGIERSQNIFTLHTVGIEAMNNSGDCWKLPI